ncbi:MAG TPA: adenosylcobinamide-GDP ribazoletransferase, partial [Pseudonocardiaceae bacterium]
MRLALSWLTILPIRVSTVDKKTAGAAIAMSPLVGVLLGAVSTGVLAALSWLHCPPLLAGLLLVGLLALATRGMHVDGLADTADGLGCYGPPERALAVMKDGGAGPFAVVTLIVVLGAQAIGFGAAVTPTHFAALAAWAPAGAAASWMPAAIWVPALAITAGRAAFPLCCRRGVPAARPDGLGALVADTQPIVVPALWWLALATVGAVMVPGRWWQGPLAVLLAGAMVLGLSAHTRRRFGGITGDVLGAASELAV